MELIVYGLAVYYWTRVLLYEAIGNGPFPAKNAVVQYVVETDTGLARESRAVHLWDRLRWLFRAYRIEGHTWTLRQSVWVCPKCLSFWIACALLSLYVFYPLALYPFAAAGLVSWLYDKS